MKPYRKNVGVVVFNSKGEVLVGARVGMKDNWQFVQGGIDEDEEPKAAVIRELYEEVGIQDAELVYENPNWISYDFPKDLDIKMAKKYAGQIQKWFLLYWDHPANECNLHIHEQEFESVKFIPIQSCVDTIVSFKRDVYAKLIEIFEPQIQKYLRSK
ncbi:MAG: RNA pyrophosphohydrolase [Leptospiraceae bacterium]|nr:RNA pyrophosphohydrolase [Leptospiraceae bacterium]